IAEGSWGWGSCFIDFDNDGWQDIYQTNGWGNLPALGFPTDTSRAWVSDEARTFTNDAAGLKLDDTEEGRGIICADFDNDGDVDILQMHLNAASGASLWMNEANANANANYLSVKLKGISPNTDGVGARITITTASGDKQYRDILLGNNFASHNPTLAYFGVNTITQLSTVHVLWPDGEETTMSNVNANQMLTINHPDL
ncbi:MAG: CRTAC1 family protein, partial [Robiginitomaculum sp.]